MYGTCVVYARPYRPVHVDLQETEFNGRLREDLFKARYAY